ncbi:HAMP domain-containing protein [Desulfatibacillum alkenivorans DSM 16219]|jgi:methyl-accepting chemotaxis protein|uniref:HAMP domain-containing protein n=1 Tax=Desulfatibacillum alkenivorans DSM 16219 TaxID=1121393 RepID=A0A1M6RVW1_9BACT|nr:methyl-accepting chemotaxis protein [Desulfatibacillum alkenivorans]SHK36593.1 HAMP domain-containing protein [Desulfatibacillum alkenivorans DSM 16219]
MRWTIRAKISLVFLIVITVVMLLYARVTYIFVDSQVRSYLTELGESTKLRLAESLSTAAATKNKALVLEITGAETVDKRIHAVVVELGEKDGKFRTLYTGVRTLGNGEYEEISSIDVITQECYEREAEIKKDGKVVGRVRAYITQEYIKGRVRSTMAGMIGMLLGLALTFFVALNFSIGRVVGKPLRKVASVLKNIAEGEGDLTARLEVKGQDEIAQLAASYNVFVEKIQFLVSKIKENADILATSTSQISATASELSASATENSSTMSQVSTTAEEVKQTSMLAHEKAELVARQAEDSAQISEEGEEATREAVEGMQRIKDEMEYIAESIVKLSEHSQNIGEIIEAVNEIANESNLLSVNASIEASKAGEYGKGFGVVAQEVKSLSDQSRQATSQVKAILNDIQTSTSAAVMAMERGSKAVETGVKLASRSGEAISVLAQSVENSAKSAAQIAASNQQQIVGFDQLTQAMESIRIASEQNTEGAVQLESATAQLQSLGQSLKDLAGRFKVD